MKLFEKDAPIIFGFHFNIFVSYCIEFDVNYIHVFRFQYVLNLDSMLRDVFKQQIEARRIATGLKCSA